MQFYLIMFFVYFVATGMWIRQMRGHGDNKIGLHNYFCLLLLITCLECALIFFEYDSFNKTGKRSLALATFCVFFTALRETVANLVCLLISLGYGIVMNVLNRYSGKIGLLSFLSLIGSSINVASFYINQHKALSRSIKVMMALPQFLIEVVFLIWIVSALLRTLSYLKVKRQDFKLRVMKQFAIVFSIGVVTYALIRLTKIGYEVLSVSEDSWRNEHKFQIAWFFTFTVTLMGAAWVFRP